MKQPKSFWTYYSRTSRIWESKRKRSIHKSKRYNAWWEYVLNIVIVRFVELVSYILWKNRFGLSIQFESCKQNLYQALEVCKQDKWRPVGSIVMQKYIFMCEWQVNCRFLYVVICETRIPSRVLFKINSYRWFVSPKIPLRRKIFFAEFQKQDQRNKE